MIAYKYRSGRGVKDADGNDVFERDIQLLLQDTIYVPTVDQLNDPAEALFDDGIFKIQMGFFKPFVSQQVMERVEEGIRTLYDKVRSSGIYSLSKVVDNELMWAYYASGHSGYAIIIDTDVLSQSYENGKWGGMYEIDMTYSSKLPYFDMSIVDKKDIKATLSCFVGAKSNAWKHESEHRLVFEEGGKCLKIDYRAIKGFVFGCRMNQSDIDYVMKLFSGRDLEYYQIILKENSYKFSLNKLSDRYPSTIKYCPNNVAYNVDELLEDDKCIGGVGYQYRSFVEDVLREVSREPFVTRISHIVVSDNNEYPHILVWTRIKHDGTFKKMRSFEYDVVDGALVRNN